MTAARKTGVGVVAAKSRVAAPAAAVQAHEVDPAFHRAILKIALELKKPTARSYDDVVATTIKAMRLDAAAFRRYLGENGARNMGLLLATARAGGL
jgi:CRP-like cAMP-binding protein